MTTGPVLSTLCPPPSLASGASEERENSRAKEFQFLVQLSKRDRALLAAVLADGQRVVGLLVPEDHHIGDLLHLGVADPLADGVVRAVDLNAVVQELLRQRLRRLAMSLTDGQDPDLDRREPEREGAPVSL